eukprot:5193420-Prymnesium_polylepis.1
MASFARPAALRGSWTIDEAALFAALKKEYELLKLLSLGGPTGASDGASPRAPPCREAGANADA